MWYCSCTELYISRDLKLLGSETDHPPPPSARAGNERSSASIVNSYFMACTETNLICFTVLFFCIMKCCKNNACWIHFICLSACNIDDGGDAIKFVDTFQFWLTTVTDTSHKTSWCVFATIGNIIEVKWGVVEKNITNLVILHLPAYEDGTDRVFQNVGI